MSKIVAMCITTLSFLGNRTKLHHFSPEVKLSQYTLNPFYFFLKIISDIILSEVLLSLYDYSDQKYIVIIIGWTFIAYRK